MSDFHGVQSTSKLSCEHCSIDFLNKFNLDRHLKSKNCILNLSHQCKNCKARFVSQVKLEIHELKNCPKKYFCSSCLSFFKTKSKYQSHIDSSHAVVSNEQ